MNVLDLFSGLGGFSLAARRVGWTTIGFSEVDEHCCQVLKKHWPDVPNYGDIRDINGYALKGPIDIITAGWPCQDISIAGKGAGLDGERSGLYAESIRLIGEIRPRFAVMENVTALLSRGMGRVLGDLAEVGYDCEWHCIPASAIGGIQNRDRVWITAYPSGDGVQRLLTRKDISQSGQGWSCRQEDLQQVYANPLGGNGWPEPLLCGSNGRVSNWVDRIRGLGNSIVPQIAEVIFQSIKERT